MAVHILYLPTLKLGSMNVSICFPLGTIRIHDCARSIARFFSSQALSFNSCSLHIMS